MVTSFLLSCMTKITDRDIAQVRKPNIRWVVFHLCNNIFDFGHVLYSINIDIYVKVFLFGVMITKMIPGLWTFYPIFMNPKDLNVPVGYAGQYYFPCRMSIHLIAS